MTQSTVLRGRNNTIKITLEGKIEKLTTHSSPPPAVKPNAPSRPLLGDARLQALFDEGNIDFQTKQESYETALADAAKTAPKNLPQSIESEVARFSTEYFWDFDALCKHSQPNKT